MNHHYEIFIGSIHSKNVIKVVFDSKEKGVIERNCIPFDYGLSSRYKDGFERFHLYDLDSPKGNHTLSILPNQIIELSLLDEIFDPATMLNGLQNG